MAKRKPRRSKLSAKTTTDASQARRKWLRELRDDKMSFHYRMESRHRKAHLKLLHQIATQAGVDMDGLVKDAERSHTIEQKHIERYHDRLVRRMTPRVARERRRRQREFRLYANLIEDDIRKVFHNPTYVCKLADDWDSEDTSPPPPMYGGGFDGRLPRVEARPDFVFETIPGTSLEKPLTANPYCLVDIGPDYPGRRTASTYHRLEFEHAPPTQDQLINEISVMMSFYGYATCFAGLPTIFWSQLLPTVFVNVHVSVEYFQGWRTPSGRTYTMEADVADETVWRTSASHSYFLDPGTLYDGEPIMLTRELGRSYSGLTLLGDRVGQSFRVVVHIDCSVSAEEKHQLAQLSFAAPNFGIQVHHVIVRTTPIQ